MCPETSLARRSLLLGGAGVATLALLGRPPAATAATGSVTPAAGASTPADARPAADLLDYTSPEAFAVAEQAYLDLDAQDNEAGLYAWGESYYLNGLLLMYRSTGEESYLDRFEDRVNHVLGSTDAARGVSDYSGRSGPCWRAAGSYTAGHGELALAGGEPGIQVRWAGATSAEASATVTRTGAAAFDLELSHPASTVSLTGLSLDPEAANYVVTAVNDAYTTGARWTAVDHRDTPSADDELTEGTVAFESQFYAFAVHTGMMIYPMAKYVRLVRSSPELGHRQAFAARTLTAVRHSVRHHRDDFVIDDDGVGDFRWPLGAPVPFDGTIQPLNQSHALGATFAELYAITGNQRYRTQVEAILKGLRLSLQEQDGAYQWPYWPVHSELYAGFDAEDEISTYTPSYTPATQAEDISHAAITLEFIQSVHESGIEDMSVDRQRFAATFIDHVIRTEDGLWYRVNGETEALPAQAVQAARWLMLADVEPAIHDQVLRVYQAEPLEPSQGSHALGIAYLNHTA